ncbi:MAG: hypothetical protein KGM42_05825 [Hyphomicrobiales bacterium]|nr:hypothetical protein [Hyphomicrobiales bacterium]
MKDEIENPRTRAAETPKFATRVEQRRDKREYIWVNQFLLAGSLLSDMT